MDSSWFFNSLTKVEYLITFNAFIYGYILSRFFSGWGRLVSNRKNLIFSPEHVLWSIFAFFMLISMWWYSWVEIKTLDTRSYTFYTSLFSPFIMYLISALYFPQTSEKEITDFGRDSKFLRRQGAVLYIVLFSFNLLRELFDTQRDQKAIYFIVGIIASFVVLFSRKRWLGIVSMTVGFITITIYMINIPSFYREDRWSFNGFSFSEYISTFFTFIYGFIVARFLDGWKFFVTNRRTIRFNTEYLLWTFLIFGLIIDFWWGLWGRSLKDSTYFGYFLITMLIPIGFSMLVSLLFTDSYGDAQSFQETFSKNGYYIYGSLILIFVADFIGATLISERRLLHLENLFLLIAISICVFAIIKRNKLGERLALTFGWIALVAHNFVSI